MFKQLLGREQKNTSKQPEKLESFVLQTTKDQHKVTDISKELYEKGIVNTEEYFALVIDNFMTKSECEELIKLTESVGYDQALVNVGGGRQKLMPDVRSSDRCIIDDERVAEMFYQQTKDYIPQNFLNDKWTKISINERLRFLRYQKGGYFKPHHDGCYVRPDGNEQSFVTFFLFLNEECDGGASTFVSLKDLSVTYPCEPKTGRLILFQHNIFHEGSLVKGGHKYALRSDFMYKKS
ncbi:uncharacterized protein [Clytia hemisphaerica]|uniref:uncharacterized protein n=1 Tax=Clytia hemisphaerica TaxID=252671 RepID=UPI0034D7169F